MGVSFKVSKTGTRFRPKPSVLSDTDVAVNGDIPGDGSRIARGDDSNVFKLEGSGGVEGGEKNSRLSGSFLSSVEQLPIPEGEVSFTLNLFLDGYSIGKPSENETPHQSAGQDVPKLLHPYDRASESLFSAIESGRLPSDILDDIPCKFTDGTIICEVRDYRKCASESGSGSTLSDGGPTMTKICLRMSLENVVKDIPMISDNSWTYGDLMELESRILKALQPQLHLEPTPKLDRLCKNPVSTKLDLGLCSLRRKRLRHAPEVVVTSNSKSQGKKICIDRVPESSNGRLGDSGFSPGHVLAEHVQENLGNNMLAMRANSFGPDLAQHLASTQPGYLAPGRGVSPSGQDIMNSYVDNSNSNASINRKREIHDGPLSPLSSMNKRQRPTNMSMGLEGMQQQQPGGQHMESFRGSDLNWKNQLLQQQAIGRGIQYANTGNQKFSQQVFEGALNQDPGSAQFSAAGQQGMRFVPKEEQIESAKLEGSDMQMAETETGHLEPLQAKHQQRLAQNNNFARSNFPQAAWNSLGQQHPEKDVRKEEQSQNQIQPPKRKTVQSPRLPAGSLVQSPLSSKSGEFPGVGPHFGALANAGVVGVQQKEKASVGMSSVSAVTSLNSGDSMQRHHQAQLAAKRRSNSIPKNQAMGMVGSPVSVGNANAPLNAASPSVGAQPTDKDIVEKFSKIEMVAMRHQLNRKKNRVDEPSRNPRVHLAHVLGESLSRPDNNDEFKDESEATLSKSLGGGSMNACKTKIITLVHQERAVQGNVVTFIPKYQTRMIMSEKANDGTVAMLYGEVDLREFQSVEELLPTLPNTHFADLLAKQFTTLMERDGYAVQQHIELRQARMSQSNLGAMLPNNPGVEMQQYGEAVPGQQQQQSNDVKPIISGNTALNPTQNLPRLLPPGTAQGLQMAQAMAQRPQIPDSQSQLPQQQQQQNPLIQQQQQHPQFQRSMMLSNNPLSNLSAIGQNPNVQLGNQMLNKQSALQFQLLQQQQQQQQQQGPHMQRKMMMGLGTAVGGGSGGNNMVGMAGLNNAVARGIGGGGISSPMAAIPGMSMNPGGANINAISQHIRAGTLAPAVHMASKLRMAQSRPAMVGGPQAAAGMTGAARQIQQHLSSASLSMLNQTLSRAGMNPMQRAQMGPMGPPKPMQMSMPGMNMYMNQQQQLQMQQQQLQLQQQQHLQQQQQLQQHQQLQQQQLQQLQQQHQEPAAIATASSLQGVVSSPQVSSPSTIGIPQMNQQQQASPQQMSQRTPMSPQLSAGAIPCPPSPQLSSQTLGSVGSIANSPMDLQGVNKTNT